MCKQDFDSSVCPDPLLLREGEQKQLEAWNGTTQACLQDACVPQLIAAQAAAMPSAVALVAASEVITYRGLNARANRLAHHLRSLGAGPETLVALCLERSPTLAVSALGVLKSGAAYLPLDPTYPSDRLAFMLNDSRALILVTKQCLAGRLPGGSWKVVDLDVDARRITRYAEDPPQADPNPANLAYVIYTSGSSGRPKGVEITHDSLLNLVFWHQRTFAVSPSDRATMVASPGFDASVWELWPYLTTGATLLVPDEAIRSAPESLRDWLVQQRVTITFLPTPLADRVMTLEWPTDATLRVLLTGGDMLHHYPPSSLPFTVVNNYGPTEATVVATSGPVLPRGDNLPPTIGRPIANTQVYILDEQLREMPIGVPGELYIGGLGLARGYLNRPDLTAEKFIPNPFSSTPRARLYKTGDLGHYLPDGQIAFLGRIDDQIKFRGHRIEPNEIVAALNRNPAVQASVLVAQNDDSGDKRLVAYLVLAPEFRTTRSALRGFLRKLLPEFMIPTAFVPLESLPLSANGKVDRDSLPVPNASNTLRDEIPPPPRTAVEAQVTAIVATLLGIGQVGANDNIFLLGGHSLLAAQLIARVNDTFAVKLPLRGVFEAPTVAELSCEIERLLLAKPDAKTYDEAQPIARV